MSASGLFTGNLVRLAAIRAEEDAAVFARWSENSHYLRLFDSDPAQPFSPKHFQRLYDEEPGVDKYDFGIRTLTEDELVGIITLDDISWPHGTGWVSIGIGDAEQWGKGLGTDAMNILLRFAFDEVSLSRVSLNVFEYNQRAIHTYDRLGFKVEGRIPGFLMRDGRRWDLIFMGLLRNEWQGAS